mmetsp:Transcript_4480/g.6337  ORF Transcript_4480/g.6337 Transcript_4480/m.6337 type:complete len:88 (-) Transcript_4480:30-293(-)
MTKKSTDHYHACHTNIKNRSKQDSNNASSFHLTSWRTVNSSSLSSHTSLFGSADKRPSKQMSNFERLKYIGLQVPQRFFCDMFLPIG